MNYTGTIETCLNQRVRRKERKSCKLCRGKWHTNCDEIIYWRRYIRCAIDGDIAKIEIIRICRVYSKQPRKYSSKVFNRCIDQVPTELGAKKNNPLVLAYVLEIRLFNRLACLFRKMVTAHGAPTKTQWAHPSKSSAPLTGDDYVYAENKPSEGESLQKQNHEASH